MGEISFFDEVAAVGSDVLNSLGGRDDVAPFLRRTRDVYLLLVDIHDDIVNATVEVSTATSLDEGQRVLNSLHHDALESVFRARRWCDELEALGHDLHVLPVGVDLDENDTWAQFTLALQEREGQVAQLYEDAMYDVLSRARNATSLDELQNYIDSVSNDLVVQKAKFDLLAKRAAAIARKR
jgi:hypothetical protein